jgi:hypothetical protein
MKGKGCKSLSDRTASCRLTRRIPTTRSPISISSKVSVNEKSSLSGTVIHGDRLREAGRLAWDLVTEESSGDATGEGSEGELSDIR